MAKEKLTAAALDIDVADVSNRIAAWIKSTVTGALKRQGVVVGISGGIDSSVVAALAAKALGPKRVLGLFTPERDSSSETLELSRMLADAIGVEALLEDITGVLDAAGCYRRRDDAIRLVMPEYADGWKAKIVLPSLAEGDRIPMFSVVARDPAGETKRARLSPSAYLGVVAATNFKQRVRKLMEYYHADRLNYAVAGTPNRLEYDQGFFVKQGDGAADVKPIAHLYKTQVYALAAHLGVPEVIRKRPPTTDTYALEQGQDEFYFSLSYDKMDLCLFAKNHGYTPEEACDAVGVSAEQVAGVFADIDRKRRATRYLHARPLLVEPIAELDALERA